MRLAGDVEQARLVVEADERWIAAFNSGDVETLVSIYAPDVVLMPPDRPNVLGREAVAEWFREFFRDNSARQSLVNEEAFAAGDWAWLRGRFELETTARATGRTTTVTGKHLVIWRRDGGGAWLATRDIWNLAA